MKQFAQSAASLVLVGLALLSLSGLVFAVLVPIDRRLRWALFLFSLAFGALTVGLVLSVRIQKGIQLVISAANRTFPGRLTVYAWEKATHAGQYLFTTITGGALYLAAGFYRIPFAHPKGTDPCRPAPVPPPQVVFEETRSILDQLRASVELMPPARSDIQLSIVIPAYNEQARLPRTVLETVRWCTSHSLKFELLIADDGSRDQTLALARLFEEHDGRIRAFACPHMGKGAAVRIGILNARGRFILFMDADGATPLNEIPKLLEALQKGYDLAIGSRVVQHPGEVEVKTPFYRRLISRSFAFFVSFLAVGGIGDTQCGFKMFSRGAAAAIFSRQKTVGFAFDVEILFIARQLALSMAEIPVNWIAQPGSKVNLIRDSTRMLWDVGRIRWLHRNFQVIVSRLPEVN
jgi:dolichyl-phosphate beta-glucosyltransferase